jgi:hypothetical protein
MWCPTNLHTPSSRQERGGVDNFVFFNILITQLRMVANRLRFVVPLGADQMISIFHCVSASRAQPH